MKLLSTSAVALLVASTLAQNSSTTCDPSTCKLPDCLCPSASPPGGLSPNEVPQFVTVTFDDSIQSELLDTAYEIMNVTNPNGCPAMGSWYVSMQYTNFALVQQWYAKGHEVADHTFTHVGQPSAQEITAARSMLYEYGGVPLGNIKGFRAPFLNYTTETLNEISRQGFLYDSSATAITDDCYWPYTLDNGLANDCWSGVCGTPKLPGVWEIPMYAVVDSSGTAQLMDVYLAGSVSDVTQWSNTNFERHYNGTRQPFGIYIHPTHLTAYAGTADPSAQREGVVNFIKSIASKKDVWFVSNEQLLKWMKNPVPVSQLAQQDYMKCQLPDSGKEICNGLENMTISSGVVQSSLLNTCSFTTSNFGTCFNCPSTAPTVDNPTPDAASSDRHLVPDNCDGVWWDPIAGQCLCQNTTCAFNETYTPLTTQ